MLTTLKPFLSQLPWLQWLIPSVPWPTTSSTCAGGFPKTLHQPGTSPSSTAAGVWYQEERLEAGSEEDWQPPAGAGSGWMKWVGPALWLTGWRWTACTCCGWEAATRRATGSTVRRCTCTPRLHQVRVHTTVWLSTATSKQRHWLCHI